MQTPVHIGLVLRNAKVFNLKNWRGELKLKNPDSLLEAVQRLFDLMGERQIDYVLVGGVAMLAYVEGRNTQDIDLIMALPALEKMPEIHILNQEQDFLRGEFDGLQIDVLLTRNQLFSEVQRKYVTKQKFVEREIPIATIQGLLLLKLYALPSLYREGNFTKVGLYENDIAMLMHDYRPALAPLLTELKKYMGEGDLIELGEIVKEIEQRIERFRKNAA